MTERPATVAAARVNLADEMSEPVPTLGEALALADVTAFEDVPGWAVVLLAAAVNEARDVARLWVAEGERWEMASGELIAALDRLAAAYGETPR